MHYFRVVPQYWRDRLQKMRDFGLNTVETYVPWNLHEPEPGEYHFDGGLDLAEFIRLAGELDLKVIVRPGPYICSEWDFGGLPYWLLKDPQMVVRSSYPPYLEAVESYFDHLFPILTPLQSSKGGPIIAMQVENEYGGFANDQIYLACLHESLRAHGVDVLLFTSDTPYDGNQQAGGLPDVLPTVNFARNAPEAFVKFRQYHPKGPLMVTEFWSGWFDHCGEKHNLNSDGGTDIDRSVTALDDILAMGASLNFYMFHGGTSFGFMNGANSDHGKYLPDVTSYDYAAPLTEWGDPSPRYEAFARVLRKHVDLPALAIPVPMEKKKYGKIHLTESASLWDVLDDLSHSQQSITPLPMENYGQDYGLILYRTYLSGPREDAVLRIRGLHDRAQVYLDGDLIAVLERETGVDSVTINIQEWGSWLDILVENQGRVNFGPDLMDRKGILGGVTLDEQYQYQWQVYPLPLKYISPFFFQAAEGQPNRFPMFFRAEFQIDQPADTFLDTCLMNKGFAWINGTNLGRYWMRGPQKRLYIPGPLLKAGKNELILLELHECLQEVVELTDHPDLGEIS